MQEIFNLLKLILSRMMKILEEIIKYKKIILISLGCLFILLLVFYIFYKYDQYNFNSQIEDLNKQKANTESQIEEINANIANLKIKEIEANSNVNIDNAEIKRLKEQREKLEKEQIKIKENINKINNMNFNGTTQEEANNSRCLAFPESPECS